MEGGNQGWIKIDSLSVCSILAQRPGPDADADAIARANIKIKDLREFRNLADKQIQIQIQTPLE